MCTRMMRTGLATALLVVIAAGKAAPGEVCVVCAEPDAHYRCGFEGDTGRAVDPRLSLACLSELSQSGRHGRCMIDRGSTAPCNGPLKTLPRPPDLDEQTEAGEPLDHDAANTGGEALPHVPPEGRAGGPATPEAVPDTSPEIAGEQPLTARGVPPSAGQPAATVDVAPPKTVKELVDQSAAKNGQSIEDAGTAAKEAAGTAAEKTGSALSGAGKAVSNAAKKTWTCITSLFGDC